VTAGLVFQVVVTGLAAGAAYGLLAIGITTAYRLTGVVHLAHGDVTGGGVFVALFVAAGTAPVAVAGISGVRLAGAIGAAVAIAALAGALLYAGGVRPFLRRSSVVGWAGALAATGFAVQGVVAAAFPRQASVFPEWLPFARRGPLHVWGAVLPVRSIVVLAGGLVVAAGLEWILTRSPYGLALQAIAGDRVAAALCGLRVDRFVASAFALVAAVGALAGLAIAPAAAVEPATGVVLGLKGLAAACVGGWRSPRQVFVAALAIGVLEAAVVSLHVPGAPEWRLGAAWRDLVPLSLAVLALGWRTPAFAKDAVE
jgi:branched-subunit amino acid ABC-type transport system permease component